MHRRITVSYTHLDVYKRQDQEAAELLFAIEKEKQTELYMPDFEKADGVMPWEKALSLIHI